MQVKWWQLITHAFYHTTFGHLSSNMFMLWAFGGSLEANEGSVGLISYYLLCSLGAHLVHRREVYRNNNSALSVYHLAP